MARIPEESDTFFCLGPVDRGKARSFAVTRGDLDGRADVTFYEPWVRSRLSLLRTAHFPVTELGSIISEIR